MVERMIHTLEVFDCYHKCGMEDQYFELMFLEMGVELSDRKNWLTQHTPCHHKENGMVVHTYSVYKKYPKE